LKAWCSGVLSLTAATSFYHITCSLGISCTKDDSDDQDDQTQAGDDECCLAVCQNKGYHCSSIVPQHMHFPDKTLTEAALTGTSCKEI